MAKIIGNLDVAANITSGGNNVVRTINNTKANVAGEVQLTMSGMGTTGQYGDTFITNENGTIISDTIVKYARLTTAEEFENEKNTIVSWNEVFNEWYRFSHGTNGLFPSSTTEVNSWSYNSTNNQIYSTVNSATYIGLVSPERYDNYNLEVNVSSTDTDDDFISLVLAFTELNGKEYTLSAVRGCGGQNTTVYWAVWYNYGQSDQQLLMNNTTGYPFTTGNETIGWSGFPNGSNIKAIREGSNITVNTTDFSAPNTYIAEMSLDLTSLPILEKFINPSKVGYGALSQAAATYKTLSFSGGNVILNIDTNQVWEYNFSTSSWDLNSSTTVYDQLKKGYIYVNQYSRQAYTLFDDEKILVVAGQNVGNTSFSQVPSMRYFESVLDSSGYQKLPTGYTEAWGMISNVTASAVATATLPVTFTSVYNVQCTIAYTSGTPTGSVFGSATNTVVTVGTSSASAVNIYYRVLGKV